MSSKPIQWVNHIPVLYDALCSGDAPAAVHEWPIRELICESATSLTMPYKEFSSDLMSLGVDRVQELALMLRQCSHVLTYRGLMFGVLCGELNTKHMDHSISRLINLDALYTPDTQTPALTVWGFMAAHLDSLAMMFELSAAAAGDKSVRSA